jgi:hypothetical protein
MFIARTIPEGVMGRVRSGARGALLEPLAALRELAEHDPGRARSPFTDELVMQIDRLVCLLDALGWSAGTGESETTIDIEEDGPALCEALSEAMRVATIQVKEARPKVRRRARRSVLPLARFAGLVEAACLESHHPAVRLFQADLEVLLNEMERRDNGEKNRPTSRRARRSAAGCGEQRLSPDQNR